MAGRKPREKGPRSPAAISAGSLTSSAVGAGSGDGLGDSAAAAALGVGVRDSLAGDAPRAACGGLEEESGVGLNWSPGD